MSPYIQLDGVSFTYKTTGFSIKDVSLELYKGQAVALTGSNGSGKTTIGKLIIGILKPDNGSLLVDSKDSRKIRLPETARKIGYLFQNPERQLFCATALDEIKFSLLHNGENGQETHQHALELLSRFSMQDRREDYPLKLSRGEKQRLILLSVFAMNTPYYILDEPTAGLDEENRKTLLSILGEVKKSGAGLCIITHDKALIERTADKVITMSQGRVANESA